MMKHEYLGNLHHIAANLRDEKFTVAELERLEHSALKIVQECQKAKKRKR